MKMPLAWCKMSYYLMVAQQPKMPAFSRDFAIWKGIFSTLCVLINLQTSNCNVDFRGSCRTLFYTLATAFSLFCLNVCAAMWASAYSDYIPFLLTCIFGDLAFLGRNWILYCCVVWIIGFFLWQSIHNFSSLTLEFPMQWNIGEFY